MREVQIFTHIKGPRWFDRLFSIFLEITDLTENLINIVSHPKAKKNKTMNLCSYPWFHGLWSPSRSVEQECDLGIVTFWKREAEMGVKRAPGWMRPGQVTDPPSLGAGWGPPTTQVYGSKKCRMPSVSEGSQPGWLEEERRHTGRSPLSALSEPVSESPWVPFSSSWDWEIRAPHL